MSRGSPIVPIRFPAELLVQVEEAIAQRNEFSRDEPWTRTGFILTAIREKLAKMERSRTSHRRKPAQ